MVAGSREFMPKEEYWGTAFNRAKKSARIGVAGAVTVGILLSPFAVALGQERGNRLTLEELAKIGHSVRTMMLAPELKGGRPGKTVAELLGRFNVPTNFQVDTTNGVLFMQFLPDRRNAPGTTGWAVHPDLLKGPLLEAVDRSAKLAVSHAQVDSLVIYPTSNYEGVNKMGDDTSKAVFGNKKISAKVFLGKMKPSNFISLDSLRAKLNIGGKDGKPTSSFNPAGKYKKGGNDFAVFKGTRVRRG
jgi:hypothetical protein